jgi:hypothetical protein
MSSLPARRLVMKLREIPKREDQINIQTPEYCAQGTEDSGDLLITQPRFPLGPELLQLLTCQLRQAVGAPISSVPA